MKVIDVYQQYFAAPCVFSGVERRAAVVKLTATSDAGMIGYEVSVSFFPHEDDEDYAVSYDACAADEIYAAPGRRARKRESDMLEALRTHADALARELGGEILWDQPLRDARYG